MSFAEFWEAESFQKIIFPDLRIEKENATNWEHLFLPYEVRDLSTQKYYQNIP